MEFKLYKYIIIESNLKPMKNENQIIDGTEKVPSRDEVINHLKEMIEVRQLQAQLQKINTSIVEDRVAELEAIMKLNHYTAKPTDPSVEETNEIPEGFVSHTVTQQDLNNNPSLVQSGVRVGDVIGIPQEGVETTENEGKPEPKKEYKSNLTVVQPN